ncbi:MAG: cobalamin B12-binding domain-containing protein [Candidatus Ranarchaeia archaeon]
MSDENKLVSAVADLDEDNILQLVEKQLAEGVNPLEIIESLREGMRIVGDRFEKGEYFLTELVFGGDLLQHAVAIIKPHLKKGSSKAKGTIVIGTVKGDIHNIGKDLVATMLECEGYTVHNLGVDLPPEAFVDAAKKYNADIIGMSTLLTSGIPFMKKTVESLKAAGLIPKTKVILGGSVLYGNVEGVLNEVGADAVATDAVDAVKKIKALMEAQI